MAVNNTQCKFMIIGSKKQRKQVLDELEANSMKMGGGLKIDQAVNFLKKLLHLPVSTPKAILHWDCGMEMVKWRTAKGSLQKKTRNFLVFDQKGGTPPPPPPPSVV